LSVGYRNGCVKFKFNDKSLYSMKSDSERGKSALSRKINSIF